MKKKIGIFCLAVMTTLALAACTKAPAAATAESTTESKAGDGTEASSTEMPSSATSSSETAEGGTFIVGFDQDFPPMGFVGDDGAYTGFDLELAAEVAKRLGKTYVPQPIAWDSKDMELASGTIDCIWNGFTMTGREDKYTWTEAYMNNSQVFVVAEDSGILSQADLAGKTIQVQADSSAEAALKELPDLTATFGTLQTTPDYNTAFMELEMGTADAIAMDIIVAAYQIEKRGGGFVMLEETLASEAYGVGFKMGNEALRDQVQTTLNEMAKDGTVKAISEKWFGEDITTIGK